MVLFRGPKLRLKCCKQKNSKRFLKRSLSSFELRLFRALKKTQTIKEGALMRAQELRDLRLQKATYTSTSRGEVEEKPIMLFSYRERREAK
jgi:hypothetical protein